MKVSALRVLPLLSLSLLETVDLDEFLFDDLLLDHELLDLGAVVALELDDFTPLVVGHDGAIAAEVFLEVLDELLNLRTVQMGVESLDGGQGFAAIALLDTNVCCIGKGRRVD